MTLHPFPQALERFDGDNELLQSMAVMIAEDAPIELNKLVILIGAKEASAASASAHALKGMLATFDEGPAVDGLHQVEKLALAGDLAAAQAWFESARASIEDLLELIRGIAESE